MVVFVDADVSAAGRGMDVGAVGNATNGTPGGFIAPGGSVSAVSDAGVFVGQVPPV